MGKTVKIVLTPEQESWLKNHFKHTKNDDIARRLGISVRSVNRIAGELGLKKSWQFIRQTQLNTATKMNESNRINGTYPPKGYVIPNREKTYFRKGEKMSDRLGSKTYAERIKNNAESVAKTRRLEKARALYGLPRQTKLNVVKRPRLQIQLRHYLKKHCGYIVDRGSFVFYYTDETKRSAEIESRPRTGFIFLPLAQ
jgi:hypothetical protein